MVLKEQKRKRTIISVLAVAVVVIIASWLALPAITADDPRCGIEDPMHEHVLACYSDTTADIETAQDWEATLPAELTGDAATDVVLVAESQIGYEESTANYQVTDNEEMNGYTRYGAWYGDNYCSWNVPFAAFCLEYGGATYDLMPETEDCSAWMDLLDNTGYFAMSGSGYVPAAGDLIFVSGDEVRAGIVAEVSEDGAQLTVVEGDSDKAVRKIAYNVDTAEIIGYGMTSANKMADDAGKDVSAEGEIGDEEGGLSEEEALTEEEPAVQDKPQARTMDLAPRAASSSDIVKTNDLTLIYNSQKDAFIKDPEYSKYYNANSPIGTAGSFHIVAFEKATLGTHTNGNVLAKTLEAGSNFGTNNLTDELSYVQNYTRINGGSASNNNHILGLGSACELSYVDNNNSFAVSGSKLDRPKTIVKDRNTAEAPFIDLVRVENEIKAISTQLNSFADSGMTKTKDQHGQYMEYKLNTPTGIGVHHMNASEFQTLPHNLYMKGFSAGKMGTIIMNVDCTGANTVYMKNALVYVDGQEQSTNEVTQFAAGKVIWNFVNAEGVTIETQRMTGMVVAPGANVNIKQNLNGTVVAENVKVEAESHRTDFTGTVVEVEQTHSVMVKKIETGYVGTSLSGAEFDLYKWSGSSWSKVNSSKLVTNSSGYVELETLDKSVAYKLVETKAPAGYVKSETPYYFWVKGSSSQTSPSTKPSDFKGNAVEYGGIMMAANEYSGIQEVKTSLRLTKSWLNSSGSVMEDAPVNNITVDIYRTANGDSNTRTVFETVTLNKADGWTATIADVTLSGVDNAGNPVEYTYDAVEKRVQEGFEVSYRAESGTGGIELTVINTKTASGYELPDAGGMGTTIFTITGIFLMLLALAMLYRRRDK